jgi:hypothetical protein
MINGLPHEEIVLICMNITRIRAILIATPILGLRSGFGQLIDETIRDQDWTAFAAG